MAAGRMSWEPTEPLAQRCHKSPGEREQASPVKPARPALRTLRKGAAGFSYTPRLHLGHLQASKASPESVLLQPQHVAMPLHVAMPHRQQWVSASPTLAPLKPLLLPGEWERLTLRTQGGPRTWPRHQCWTLAVPSYATSTTDVADVDTLPEAEAVTQASQTGERFCLQLSNFRETHSKWQDTTICCPRFPSRCFTESRPCRFLEDQTFGDFSSVPPPHRARS